MHQSIYNRGAYKIKIIIPNLHHSKGNKQYLATFLPVVRSDYFYT